MTSVPGEQPIAESAPIGGGRKRRRLPLSCTRWGPSLADSGLGRHPIIRTVVPPKIYTRTGDTGETSLFGTDRVSKADPLVEAYGDVDELNAWLGFVRSCTVDSDLDAALVQIQRDLFAVGAQLADRSDRLSDRVTKAFLADADVVRLEGLIDLLERELPPLTQFIFSGGSPAGAALHVARTVARRAERRIVALAPPVDALLVRYINRLSDLLFVMARAINHRAGRPETTW